MSTPDTEKAPRRKPTLEWVKKKQQGRRILNAKEKHLLKMAEATEGKVRTLYEELKVGATPKERKRELIAEVLKLIGDDIKDTCLKRVYSWVYSICVKHGTPEQRMRFYTPLQGHWVTVCSEKNGHHLPIAFVQYLSKQQVTKMAEELLPHVHLLVRRKFGAMVIEKLYNTVNKATQARLLLHTFAESKLAEQAKAEGLTPEQFINGPHRDTLVEELARLLEGITNRGYLDPPITHRLLALQMRFGNHAESCEIAGNLHQGLIHMCHTLYGSQTALHCLAISDAEGRDAILETFRGSVGDMVRSNHAYLVVCRVFDLIENHDLITDVLLADLADDIVELLRHPVASKVFLHLLIPGAEAKRKALGPQHAELLWNAEAPWETLEVRPPAKVVLCTTNPAVRHRKIIKDLLPAIVGSITSDLTTMLQNYCSRRVISALLAYDGPGKLLKQSVYKTISSTVERVPVVYVAKTTNEAEKPDETPEPIVPKEESPPEAKKKKTKRRREDAGDGEAAGRTAPPKKKRKRTAE